MTFHKFNRFYSSFTTILGYNILCDGGNKAKNNLPKQRELPVNADRYF